MARPEVLKSIFMAQAFYFIVLVLLVGLATSVSGSSIAPDSVLVLESKSGAGFGHDGPWNAIEATFGQAENSSTVHLYPAGFGPSVVSLGTVCEHEGFGDKCTMSNEYLSLSKLNTSNIEGDIFTPHQTLQYEDEVLQTVFYKDTITLSGANGDFISPNTTEIDLVTSGSIGFPGGLTIPPSLGFLSLGDHYGNSRELNGGAVLLREMEKSLQTSRSWGLHYGSSLMKQTASLVYGGYSQSLMAGPVATYKFGANREMGLTLQGVSARVLVKTDRSKSRTILDTSDVFKKTGPLEVSLSPEVPYMYLPPELCEAIAEVLPVSYNSTLGLYIWNSSLEYRRFIQSLSFLEFNFATDDGKPLRIMLSFKLLSLSLTPPIVSTTTPYFPCRPKNPSDGKLQLGRAFLQGVYLAANLRKNVFWVAQGMGPGRKDANLYTAIDRDMSTISAAKDLDDYELSWLDVIHPFANLGDEESPVDPGSEKGKPDITTGGAVGISFGVVGVLSLCVGGILLYRRRKRRLAKNRTSNGNNTLPGFGSNSGAGTKPINIKSAFNAEPVRRSAPPAVVTRHDRMNSIDREMHFLDEAFRKNLRGLQNKRIPTEAERKASQEPLNYDKLRENLANMDPKRFDPNNPNWDG